MRIAIFMDLNLSQINGITAIYKELIGYASKNSDHELMLFTYGKKNGIKNLSKNTTVCETNNWRYNIPYYPEYPLFCLFKPKLRLSMICRGFRPDAILTVTPMVWRGIGSTGLDIGKRLGIKVFGDYHTDIIKFTTPYISKLIDERKISLSYILGVMGSLVYYYAYKDTNLLNNFPKEMDAVNSYAGFDRKVMLGAHFAAQLRTSKYGECDAVFVSNEKNRDYLSRLIGRDKMMIFGRGVNTRIFNPGFRSGGFRRRYGIKNEKVLLYVGRVSIEKNLDGLIACYELVKKRIRGIKMMIVGDGPYKKFLQKKHPGIIFTGYLKGKELSQAYASSDLLIFPSKTDTFGMVRHEALASGINVVDFNSDKDHAAEIIKKLGEKPPTAKIKDWKEVFDALFEDIHAEIKHD